MQTGFKGTHTICFGVSFYILNEKPMIPRTDFHCITRWVAHSVKIGNAFAYFVVSLLTSKYKYLNKVFFDCKINNINEQDESFFTVSQAHDKKRSST